MGKISKFGLFLFACLLFVGVGCSKVPPGNVGILVNQYGTQKGVQDFPIKTGRVWYNPWTHDLYIFPTFMQNAAWGAGKGESITFNSSEGSSITADVGLAYSLKPELVPHLFIEFRQDIDTITHGYLRNKVRDVFNRHAAKYKAVDIMSDKKEELLVEVKKDLDSLLTNKGFIIDSVSFLAAPNPDQRVKDSISLVIEATQKAIQAENKVKQIEAEARQAIALSNGKADAMLAEAEGKAKSILVEAEAQAKANKVLNESLTPELTRYKAIESWDGRAPMVLGGDASSLLLQLPAPVAKPAK
jgi:regulator of protease activity HflC (stomatin/prohibitin superfamily)